jgi:hypothetical protein
MVNGIAICDVAHVRLSPHHLSSLGCSVGIDINTDNMKSV